jgi:xanthine dehydrogenase accessory factor
MVHGASDSVLEAIAEWATAGLRVAVATVVATKLSAPQPVGTKMAVSSSGAVVGAVSGGCVEGAVVEVAEGLLAGQTPQLLDYGIADELAWSVGLPCGGEISVWVEPCAPDGLHAEFLTLARTNQRAVRVTALPPSGRTGTVEPAPAPAPAPVSVSASASASASGRSLLIGADARARGTLGSAELDALAIALGTDALRSETSALVSLPGGEGALFVEVSAPRPRLIIIGAVDFAAPLASAAKLAGWRAYVVDPRARFATPERFPDAEGVIARWPQDAIPLIGGIDPATAIAVLTHEPALDDAALTVALASDAAYIGAMGSRRSQDRRRARLAAAGHGEAELDRISAPIGLDLGARSSGETALSIMSEIIALRHGRDGGRLSRGRGTIHAAKP